MIFVTMKKGVEPPHFTQGNKSLNLQKLQSSIDKSEKNVRRIEWAVLDWNVEAINFYKKNGAYVSKEWQIAQMNELAINNFISKNEDI